MVLTLPLHPMLARPADALPGPAALPGGVVFEPKWDGYRAVVFAGGEGAFLQSRNGKDLTDAFPEIVRAVRGVDEDLVVDGEVVLFRAGRLEFAALQRRMAAGKRRAAELAREEPVHFVAFDLLRRGGRELLDRPYRRRRAALEEVFAEHDLRAPWSLTPATADRDQADEWLRVWPSVGVEGVVAKGRDQPYRPGERGWIKVRARETTEALIGAVTGAASRPETVLLGRYDGEGVLRLVGRSSPLTPALRTDLGSVLAAAGPGHPWHGMHISSHWGSREPLDFTCVEVEHVAEIEGDVAVDRGRYRHSVRVRRRRADLAVPDVPAFTA